MTDPTKSEKLPNVGSWHKADLAKTIEKARFGSQFALWNRAEHVRSAPIIRYRPAQTASGLRLLQLPSTELCFQSSCAQAEAERHAGSRSAGRSTLPSFGAENVFRTDLHPGRCWKSILRPGGRTGGSSDAISSQAVPGRYNLRGTVASLPDIEESGAGGVGVGDNIGLGDHTIHG